MTMLVLSLLFSVGSKTKSSTVLPLTVNWEPGTGN